MKVVKRGFKSLLKALLVLVLTMSLVACSTKEGSTNESDDVVETETEGQVDDKNENNEESNGDGNLELTSVLFEEFVVVDNDELSVTVTEFTPSGDWGPTFKLLLENKTDYNLRYSFDDVSVNGIMLDPFFVASVAAGKKAYEEMSWLPDALTETGINYIANVEGTFTVGDDDDWGGEYIFNERTLLEVGYEADLGEATFDLMGKSGFEKIVLVDDDNIRAEVIDFDPEGDWGATLVMLIENKTDMRLMFSADEVSVNKFMLDPFWTTTIAPGKMAYGELNWHSDQLKESKIVPSEVEEIEFILSASDDDDWMADDFFNERFVVVVK